MGLRWACPPDIRDGSASSKSETLLSQALTKKAGHDKYRKSQEHDMKMCVDSS